jgi:hypothetical protein
MCKSDTATQRRLSDSSITLIRPTALGKAYYRKRLNGGDSSTKPALPETTTRPPVHA